MGRLAKYLTSTDNTSSSTTSSDDTRSDSTSLVSSKYDLIESTTELEKVVRLRRYSTTTTTTVKQFYMAVEDEKLLGMEECDVGSTLMILNTNLRMLGYEAMPVSHDLIGYEGLLDSALSGVKKFFNAIFEAIHKLIEYIMNLINKVIEYFKNLFKKTNDPEKVVDESLKKAQKKATEKHKNIEEELDDLVENTPEEVLSTKEKILLRMPMVVWLGKGINDKNIEKIATAINVINKVMYTELDKITSLIASDTYTKNLKEVLSSKKLKEIVLDISAGNYDKAREALISNAEKVLYNTENTVLAIAYLAGRKPENIYSYSLVNDLMADINKVLDNEMGKSETRTAYLLGFNPEKIDLLVVDVNKKQVEDKLQQLKDLYVSLTQETDFNSFMSFNREFYNMVTEILGMLNVDIITIDYTTVVEVLGVPIREYIENSEIPVMFLIDAANRKALALDGMIGDKVKMFISVNRELKDLKNYLTTNTRIINKLLEHADDETKYLIMSVKQLMGGLLYMLEPMRDIIISYVKAYRNTYETKSRLAKYLTILTDYYVKIG